MNSSLSSVGVILALLGPSVLAQQSGDVQTKPTPTTGVAPARSGEQLPTYQPLHLRYAQFDPTVATPSVPATLKADSDVSLYVVQVRGLPRADHRDALRGAGATLHGYVPDNAYLVRMPAGTAFQVSAMPFVRSVGHYEPAYRLEPWLIAEHLSGGPVPARKYNIVVVDKHTDKPGLGRKIVALGGTVDHEQPGSVLLEVSLTGPQLLQAARLDEVLWIDRWTPTEEDMNNARIQGGGNYVESAGGYTGTGIRAHIYEGLEAGHVDFSIVPTNVLSCGSAQDHGHCTAGIVAGNGTSHPNARGMAPGAALYYTNYSCVNAGLSRWQVIQNVVNTQNCFQTTASWGNNRTTAYTSISAESDDIIFDHDIPWTQSQSNAGNTAIPRNSRPQAWAKNIFSIGGVQHFDNSNAADDSWLAGGGSIGFAADGRIKPDLCAYYDAIWTSDLTGNAGYASTSYYTSFGGTSGATPICNGHLALAQQMFTDGIFNNALRNPMGTRFSNRGHTPTMKALMIATAKQYSFNAASVDNKREHQGWGFPDLRNMYDNRNRMFIVDEDDVLLQGQTATYDVEVAAGTPELKVAMSYIDPMGNPAVLVQLINDLDLNVTSPGGVVYRGNNGLKTGNYSTAGGVNDNRDPVECVFVQNPPAGTWRVQVFARLVAQDNHLETTVTDADFGLVVNGGREANGCAFHVPDDDATTGTCNVIPFGNLNTSATLVNQKYQTIVRAGELGNQPGLITGLGFAPCGSGDHENDTILVRMSRVPPGWVMSTTFANNMPAPVTVLSSVNYVWQLTADQWNELGLMNYFNYDGVSDVVVEITVTGNHFTGANHGMHRGATTERVYATSWVGAPPPTGSTDLAAAKLRIEMRCANTHTYGRGCARLDLSTAGSPVLGGRYQIQAQNALPSANIWLNAGFNNQLRLYPWDLTPFGFTGCSFYHDIVATFSATTTPNGTASALFGVPGNPALMGAKIYFQWVQLNPAAPGGAAFSNYARIVYGE